MILIKFKISNILWFQRVTVAEVSVEAPLNEFAVYFNCPKIIVCMDDGSIQLIFFRVIY